MVTILTGIEWVTLDVANPWEEAAHNTFIHLDRHLNHLRHHHLLPSHLLVFQPLLHYLQELVLVVKATPPHYVALVA